MEGIQTFKGSWPWPWPWIRPYSIPSCITHRPLPIYQISLKSKKLFVDGRTDGHFPPLILLGRLLEVDLKTFIENTIWNHFQNTWLFFFVPMLEFPYHRPISDKYCYIVIYLPYRLTSSDATRRCVFVYVGKLVGWKTSTFFIQRSQTFFFLNFGHVFTFFKVFIFFLERFLHLWGTADP